MNTNGVTSEMMHQLQMMHYFFETKVEEMSPAALSAYYNSLQCAIDLLQM